LTIKNHVNKIFQNDRWQNLEDYYVFFLNSLISLPKTYKNKQLEMENIIFKYYWKNENVTIDQQIKKKSYLLKVANNINKLIYLNNSTGQSLQ